MDLENLDITDLGLAVRSYRNLWHHRTVFLEGIRRIAARNMIHMTEVRDQYLGLSSSSKPRDWIRRVQSKMLRDQGVKDSRGNRLLLERATFYPLQTYLALLYAEIDNIRNCQLKSPLFDDDVLFPFLDENEDEISELRRFRDSFLHPRRESTQMEIDFLTRGVPHNSAPEFSHPWEPMQAMLDDYLLRVRLKLHAELSAIFADLPRIQCLYCVSRALMINFERMERHMDFVGMEHVATQTKEVADEMAEMAESIGSWSPTHRQTRMAITLSDFLNIVSPSGPEQRFENPTTRQTPMNLQLLTALLFGIGRPPRYGKSRAATHTIMILPLIRRLLFTVAVLLNEVLTWQGELSREQVRELAAESSYINAHQARGLRMNDVIAAPIRVSAALLYEPLRLYSQMEQNDVSVRDDDLAEFAAHLGVLGRYRNTVFHVLDHRSKSSESLDFAKTYPDFDLFRLYKGLIACFGPYLPLTPGPASAT